MDTTYVDRLIRHTGILVAYEDSRLAHDVDRVMLAVVFMRNHCEMVLAEIAPDIHARAEEE